MCAINQQHAQHLCMASNKHHDPNIHKNLLNIASGQILFKLYTSIYEKKTTNSNDFCNYSYSQQTGTRPYKKKETETKQHCQQVLDSLPF